MSTWERLTRTKIYKNLREKEGKGSNRDQDIISLVNSVSKIVKDTDILLTRIQDAFPEYTLHDATHSVKLVELMDKIIPNETLKSLNALELSILILSAYLHDIGMVKSREGTKKILKSKDFIEFREENDYISQSIEDTLKIGDYRIATELEDALITEFIREKHGKRTHDYILENYGDNPIMEYCDVNFAEDLALVCASHCFDTYDLAERKREGSKLIDIFRRDKMIHDKEVNLQYLAICLRLADIMDFDRERTPKILFKYISPKSKISLNEWMKHLSITGWKISRNEIKYEAECTHPVYQHVLYKFINQIDTELERCNYLVNDYREEIARKYKLDLPVKVNRTYILSKGFYYGPFEFSLDYDRILALLMGEQLYGKKNVAFRELLQNAIDACRHRRAFENLNNKKGYKPQIKFFHWKKEGYDIIEVEDNGIGMDVDIIQNYFMKIGVSYYRSREFDKERMEYKKKGFDFDPVSRYGVGILSCFMIADKVVVETFRAKASQMEKSKPLEVEIEGPSQFFVMSDGKRKIYGTKVTLFLKKNQEIDLLKILKECAKHVEFPISVKTGQISKAIKLKDEGFKIEPISGKLLEGKISEIEIDLSKINKFNGIKGRLNLYFLKDDGGKLCFMTDEIMISGTEFRKQVDRKMMLDIYSQVIPYGGKEEILRYFPNRDGRRIKIDEISPRDFMDLLSWRHVGPFGDYVREYIDRHTKINDLYTGQFSCDGISVDLTYRYLELGIPHQFDINVIGDDKPNLRVARDQVIEDEKLEIFRNKIKTIVADVLYEQFLNNTISDIPDQRYTFVTRLYGRTNLFVFEELLKKDHFRKEILLIKVQKGKKEIYLSLSDIIKEFSGKIYLLEVLEDYYKTELPKPLKNTPVINKSEDFLIDLIGKSSELTFFTNEKRDRCYFELSLKDIDATQYETKSFTFANYSRKYREILYCKNRLKALNSNHPLGKMYFRFKESNKQPIQEINDIFERLFKEIISLWKMSDKCFNEIIDIVKELKKEVSSLDDISKKDVDKIAINKSDFHFW